MSSWLVGPGELRRRAALRSAPPFFREGLLCALVIAPSSLPRNRFPSLFARPEAMLTRKRAAQLRSLVRHLAGSGRIRVELVDLRPPAPGEPGTTFVHYRIPEMRAERKAWLEGVELAVVRVALGRVARGGVPSATPRELDPRLAPTDHDKVWVERVLSEWGHAMGLCAVEGDSSKLGDRATSHESGRPLDP